MLKKIIYKPKKPFLIFKNEDVQSYGPRIKSAPPMEINFDVSPEEEARQPIRLTKADGTLFTAEDLLELSDSDTGSASTGMNESLSSESSTHGGEEAIPEDMVAIMDGLSLGQQATCDIQRSLETTNADRAAMLDNLIKIFGEREPEKRRNFYSLDEIFSAAGREHVVLKLKLKRRDAPRQPPRVEKPREDTCIELARLELNRLTAKNLYLVVSNIKAIKISKISEMKEIAGILFKKAVSEPTFVKHYACLVHDLKKDWKSEEERTKGVNQTVFFGTILTLTLNALENKEKWQTDFKHRDNMTFEERKVYEGQLEEAEIERYKKKRATLGTIEFLSCLYSLNVISYKHINSCIQTLSVSDDMENVEVLCNFLLSVGEKLVISGKEGVISSACQGLAGKRNDYEARIRFLIERVLEQRARW
jgi:translation initiation factor 4G